MNELQIKIHSTVFADERGEDADSPRGISIRASNIVLTKLLREGLNEPSDFVDVPLTSLAFWVIDHWWRLRWESIPPGGITSEWREAHELASVGGGFAWPRITIWGEEPRIGLIARSDPQGVMGPVRFLTDALVFVSASDFETEIDRFCSVATEHASVDDHVALLAAIQAVQSERRDAETASWRRLEAMAGFDPDEAPDALMAVFEEMLTRYSQADIEETASAAPGPAAASILSKLLNETPLSEYEQVEFAPAVRIGSRELRTIDGEPWEMAEAAAGMIRNDADLGSKPLKNKGLGELVGSPATVFKSRSAAPIRELPYGLRLNERNSNRERVLLRSRWSHDRRFELARCLGDAIWTASSSLGPISRSSTARQKFQRAFAASLLCPSDALTGFLDTDRPSDSDLSAAAQYFHVSERVVRTVLVNKHVVARHRLGLPVSDLRDERSIEELAEAA
jgi:hypothetical protein